MTIPRRLQRVINKHDGKYHPIAEELGVNVYHVYNIMKRGTEPQRADIRAKMYLPKTKHKPRRPDFRPPHINWWRHLDKYQRHAIIRSAYEQH